MGRPGGLPHLSVAAVSPADPRVAHPPRG